MFDFDVHPCILPVYLGVSLFLISMNLYYLSKKKKKKKMPYCLTNNNVGDLPEVTLKLHISEVINGS